MTDYWMKLYIEILDDPKMATLPDRIWRRIIEIFLIAKKLGKNGHLPDTRQIAWMLRMSPDELESDMSQITQTGVIMREVNGWYIPKFTKRQAASTEAERKRAQRDRERNSQYIGDNVTKRDASVTDIVRQSTEYRLTENRLTETETEDHCDVFSVYEHEIGMLTPMISDELQDAEKTYPVEWIVDALKESSRMNKRSWKYALAILKRWKTEGRSELSKQNIMIPPEPILIKLSNGQVVEGHTGIQK